MRLKARPKRYAWIGDAPPHPEWEDTLLGIEQEVWRIVNDAQQTGWGDAATQSALGAIKNYMEMETALIQGTWEPAPSPAPTPPPAPTGYQLGQVVDDITAILRGFAFTQHWYGSQEGQYATDWYPRSTTEKCANCHRMPLALPVGGTLRLSAIGAPTGGSLYTVIAKTDDGYDVAFTHVDVDARKGRFEPNQVFGFVGISGLESFDAAGMNPAHNHTAWGRGMPANWNGDAGNLAARDFFGHYGFTVELRDPRYEASPQSYMAGVSCGGMPR